MLRKFVLPGHVTMMALCLLAVFMLVQTPVQARNPDLSNWIVNLAEGPDATEPAWDDRNSEIAVEDSTIHVIWFAMNQNYEDHLYYRRSLDNGQTWEPKQLLFTMSRQTMDRNPAYRRMAVSNGKVHIVVNYGDYTKNFAYLRSTDQGATFEPAFQFTSPDNGSGLFVSALGERVTISYQSKVNWNPNVSFEMLMSEDGGESFVKRVAYSANTGSNSHFWNAWDMRHVGNTVAVIMSVSNYQTFSNLIIAASHDNGQNFTVTKLSFPSNSGQDEQGGKSQDQHHVPKIAIQGDAILVTWHGKDANGVHSIFLARSRDGGATWDPIQNLTEGLLPAGKVLAEGQETLATAGHFVYAVFLSTAGDVYVRSSSDDGTTFSGLKKLTTSTPFTNSGWWPIVKVDPSDATGATAVVFWSSTGFVTTKDGGTTFNKPIQAFPIWSHGGFNYPQIAMGSDGVLHYVVASKYSGGTDVDIFYRAIESAPSPTATNSALSIFSSRTVGPRYDNMSVRASAGLAFDTGLTAEVWVYPYPDGASTGTSSVLKPILSQQENSGEGFAYSLGTWQRDGRQALGTIKTDTGEFWVHPSVGTEGLVPDGAWSHLALTYDANGGADNLKLYLNGALIASSTANGALKTGDGLFFVGRFGAWDIDEVRLWNRARSANEIMQTIADALTGTEPNLAAYYNFNSTTKDITGHGHDGLLMYQESFVPGVPIGALAADFAAKGLWRYDGAWTRLTTQNPGSAGLADWSGGLAADLDAAGLWNHDGSTWTRLSTWNAGEAMTGWTGGLAVDFNATGLWNRRGTAWSRLTTWNAEALAGWSGGLAADFGAKGLWNYDGGTWRRLTTWDAGTGALSGWSEGLAVDFDGGGLWNYDGAAWRRISTWDPGTGGLSGWSESLAADFDAKGLWSYDGLSWRKLTGWNVGSGGLAGWGIGLSADFDANGVWDYDGAAWTRLSTWNAEGLERVD